MGEFTLSRTQICEWHKVFSEGHEVRKNFYYTKRPSTSFNEDKIQKVNEIVLEHHRVGIREIAEDPNISFEMTLHILVNVLGMKRVNARLVPKYLNAPSHSNMIMTDPLS